MYLIQNEQELTAFCRLETPAYIQEYIETDRDIRVVVIGNKIVHAYWRISPPNDFRSNVAVGATISLEAIPQEALNLAHHAAITCRWDDVGIDICQSGNQYYVLEANMKYGKEGFRTAGIDYSALMEDLIANGDI